MQQQPVLPRHGCHKGRAAFDLDRFAGKVERAGFDDPIRREVVRKIRAPVRRGEQVQQGQMRKAPVAFRFAVVVRKRRRGVPARERFAREALVEMHSEVVVQHLEPRRGFAHERAQPPHGVRPLRGRFFEFGKCGSHQLAGRSLAQQCKRRGQTRLIGRSACGRRPNRVVIVVQRIGEWVRIEHARSLLQRGARADVLDGIHRGQRAALRLFREQANHCVFGM